MYWNSYSRVTRLCCSWLTLTWDVLKCWEDRMANLLLTININMRCIEIIYVCYRFLTVIRLTLTWDVLKCPRHIEFCGNFVPININMRCIEILQAFHKCFLSTRLTLTWDVLKYATVILWNKNTMININMRCIEMSAVDVCKDGIVAINTNMRCIEITVRNK